MQVKILKKTDKLINSILFIRLSDGDHEKLKQDGDAEESSRDLRQDAAAIDQKQEHSGRQQRGNDQKSRADVRRKERPLKPLISKIVIHIRNITPFP